MFWILLSGSGICAGRSAHSMEVCCGMLGLGREVLFVFIVIREQVSLDSATGCCNLFLVVVKRVGSCEDIAKESQNEMDVFIPTYPKY
jgi:hypothetical protein